MGPGYDSLEWYKDDIQFPWEKDQDQDRNAILYRLVESEWLVGLWGGLKMWWSLRQAAPFKHLYLMTGSQKKRIGTRIHAK